MNQRLSGTTLGWMAAALLAIGGCAADLQSDVPGDTQGEVIDEGVQSAPAALAADAQELAFTELVDPAGIGTAGETKTRLLITTARRYARVFGHDAPADVDFDAGDAVIFYSAGVKPTGGYQASVLSVVLQRHRLHVKTRLESPGDNCIVTQSLTKPNVLVKVTLPAVVRFVRFHVRNTVRDCSETPPFCGGIAGFPCPDPDAQDCIDDPSDDCDPANGGADCGGICVPKRPPFCGGFGGFACPDPANQDCIDDPSDDCDPANGGADCGGICVPKTDPCATVRCRAGTVCQVNDAGNAECVAIGPFCGGIAARPCPGLGECIDNPTDSCDPRNGGADCGGVCVCEQTASCPAGSQFESSPKVCDCAPSDINPCAAVLCQVGTTCQLHQGEPTCIPNGSEDCGPSICGPDTDCCNFSCGVCLPPGRFCTQQACL